MPNRSLEQRQLDVEHRVGNALRAAIVCVIVVIAGFAVSFWKADQAIDQTNENVTQIQAERHSRVDTISDVIEQTCNTNNSQDQLLASLLSVSINSQGNFGSSVNQRKLTNFQRDVLGAVVAIQRLQAQGPPSTIQQAFTEKIKTLRDLTPCQKLVALYVSGDPIPTNADALDEGN